MRDLRRTTLAAAVLAALLAAACFSGCGAAGTAAGPSGGITARQLTGPNALVGPGPSGINWSPSGAELTYVEARGDSNILYLRGPSGEKQVLLDPSTQPDNIDPTTAQWSPDTPAASGTGGASRGTILLVGDTSLWLLDVASRAIKPIAKGGSKTSVMFSPDGKEITYVTGNDLYSVPTGGGQPRRLTTDGSEAIYNGVLDWVYTEELATRDAQPAYATSPDGSRMFYLKLDDSGVQQHPVTDYDPVPPTTTYTRYPVAGSTNPKASLHVIARDGSQDQPVSMPQDTEYVLPFFTWTPDSKEAIYITVNREQNKLKLNAYDPATRSNRTVLQETDPDWINENNYAAPMFVEGGRSFLWLSERDGFMHLYLCSTDGNDTRQLTKGDWLIDTTPYGILTPGRPVHVDPSGTWAYFCCTKDGPLERQLYRVNIKTGELFRLSRRPGFNALALSGDGRYLAQQCSSVKVPPVTVISNADGTAAKVIAKCAGPSLDLPKVTREFVDVQAHDGTTLKAQMVKPENFDPKKKYGLVVHWYGGPGLQLVSNRYGTTNIFNIIERDVLYTQEGFIVWRLDNRGSFGRGHAFETPVYGHLGPAALDDQLAGIEYLRSLPYVDTSRIGTDGKSFGGFMTLYGLEQAPDVFHCGVAGSGPTRWDYYDTIYTERYMGTPQANPGGYAETDLIAAAEKVKASPLIIHGLADTNVHLQNSVNFIQALEHDDKPFDFVPLPNEDHHYEGDGLATALSQSAAYFALQLR
jgi:dipeptidyl-peptidase-4